MGKSSWMIKVIWKKLEDLIRIIYGFKEKERKEKKRKEKKRKEERLRV